VSSRNDTRVHKTNKEAQRLLCVIDKTSLNTVVRLRNYVAPGMPSTITILEALLASCASSFVRIGEGHAQKYLMNASLVTNNPTQEAIADAHSIFRKKLACVLSIGAKPWAPITISDISGTYTPNLAESISRTNEEQTDNDVARQIDHLGLYFRFRLPYGPAETVESSPSWIGALEGVTSHYLDTVRIENSIDLCVSKLQRKVGLEEGAISIPRLTGHFVMRDEPWCAMKKALIDEPEGEQGPSQRIMVLSGFGGNGKTQLARKFALSFQAQ